MEFIKNIFTRLSEVDYHSILNTIPFISPIPNIKKEISNKIQSIFLDYFIWGIRKYYNIYFSFCKMIVHIKKYNFIEYICNFFKKTPEIPTFTINEISLYYIDNEYHFENLHKEIIYNEITEDTKQNLLTKQYIESNNKKKRNKEIIDTYISINNKYIYVCQKSKVTSYYMDKESKTKFIYIIYINNVTKETVELTLDKEMYKIGNQLFSPAFVYKLLFDVYKESKFNIDYTIEIIDNQVVMFILNKNKIIELYEEGYGIII